MGQLIQTWFENSAQVEFNKCHRAISPQESTPSKFRPNVNFPKTKPEPQNYPWLALDPITQPQAYLDSVLNYAMQSCGSDYVDWDGTQCGWFHAPWMHDLREPMHGLTRERSSRLGELHPSQTTRTANWAVSMYNDVGGHGFHRIWGEDRAYPKTKDFAFDDGTVAVKLLFSLAAPEQVPYLRYAKTWDIHDGKKIVKARLMQIDVLVKDARLTDGQYPAPNDDLVGWAMGSYLYNGAIETSPRCDQVSSDVATCEQSRWRDRMVPIGIQWGNDPQSFAGPTPPQGTSNPAPVQHWLNDDVTTMFANIRTMSGHPPHLGRDGRMNGPVDNHRSTCLACHGRAVDFGRAEPDWLRYIPFVVDEGASNEALRPFFRNLNSDEPFVAGTQSLDYSLQAALGVAKYRAWVNTTQIRNDLKDKTSDVTPAYAPYDAIDGELTIATWNIANLHHQSGEPLRMRAAAREDVDFTRLRDFAATSLGAADIIALQEIGSPLALSRIFPADKYHLILSDRYQPGTEHNAPDRRGIYNALAISKQRFPHRPKVSTVDALSLTHFEFDKRTGLGQDRATRSAMSVELTLNDKPISLLNVHMKSICHTGKIDGNIDESHDQAWQRYPCRTLAAQVEILENWIDMQGDRGRNVVILGDFNRQLNATDGTGASADDVWRDLNDGKGAPLVKGPSDPDDVCWPNHDGRHVSHIDMIIANDRLVSEAQMSTARKIGYDAYDDPTQFPEYAGRGRYRLSDHCPVILTLGGN